MKHTLQSILVTGVILLVNTATGILAARFLLPEGRGILAAVLLWPTLIAMASSVSLGQSVAYFSAVDRTKADETLLLSLILSVSLAILAGTVGYFSLPRLLAAYGRDTVAIARVYLLFVPLSLVGSVLVAHAQGTLRIGAWNIMRLQGQSGYLVGVIIAIFVVHPSVFGFVLAALSGQFLLVFVAFAFWIRIKPRLRLPSLFEARQILVYSLGVHLPGIIVLANRQITPAIIVLFLTAERLAMFVVAVAVVSLITTIAWTLAQLTFPKVANQSTLQGKAIVFGRYIRFTLALCAAGTLAIALTGPKLIPLLYGKDFLPAVEVLKVLVMGAMASSLKAVLASGLKAQFRLRAISIAELLGFSVQLAALYMLLPRFGLPGTAWAYVLGQITSALLLTIEASRTFRLSVLDLTLPTVADFRYAKAKAFELGGRS